MSQPERVGSAASVTSKTSKKSFKDRWANFQASRKRTWTYVQNAISELKNIKVLYNESVFVQLFKALATLLLAILNWVLTINFYVGLFNYDSLGGVIHLMLIFIIVDVLVIVYNVCLFIVALEKCRTKPSVVPDLDEEYNFWTDLTEASAMYSLFRNLILFGYLFTGNCGFIRDQFEASFLNRLFLILSVVKSSVNLIMRLVNSATFFWKDCEMFEKVERKFVDWTIFCLLVVGTTLWSMLNAFSCVMLLVYSFSPSTFERVFYLEPAYVGVFLKTDYVFYVQNASYVAPQIRTKSITCHKRDQSSDSLFYNGNARNSLNCTDFDVLYPELFSSPSVSALHKTNYIKECSINIEMKFDSKRSTLYGNTNFQLKGELGLTWCTDELNKPTLVDWDASRLNQIVYEHCGNASSYCRNLTKTEAASVYSVPIIKCWDEPKPFCNVSNSKEVRRNIFYGLLLSSYGCGIQHVVFDQNISVPCYARINNVSEDNLRLLAIPEPQQEGHKRVYNYWLTLIVIILFLIYQRCI